MGTVYSLTLRQLAGKWRLVIMTILAALPVLIALVSVASKEAMAVRAFEDGVLGAMIAGSIAPLVVLAIAAAALGNEVEDRTLANLTLAPLPRWQVAVPKLLAVITLAGPFIALSAGATAYVAYLGDLRATLSVMGASLAAVALYASVFVWLGLASAQAIGIGLLYIVVWEGLFAGFVTGVRLLSIRYHAVAMMHGFDARLFAPPNSPGPAPAVPSLTATLVVTAVVVAVFLALTVRKLRRMDVP